MDKYAITIETYNKAAKQFEDKFMNLNLYNDSYDKFCKLVDKRNADIFEIACGPGNITNNPAGEFMVMDCRDIYKIDKKYEAIMCGFCLPYLTREESAKLIGDASGLIHPDGLIYISTMEGDYTKSGFEKPGFSDQGMIYIHYHQEDYLTKALNDSGFEIIALHRQDYPEHDGRISTDMIIIAKKK